MPSSHVPLLHVIVVTSTTPITPYHPTDPAVGDISVEAFTSLLIFKNMFSFALTWTAYEWILRNGIVKTFNIIASVQVGICLLSIPMYIFGKKVRGLLARRDIWRLTRLDDVASWMGKGWSHGTESE
jgi:hypothetical protein